MFALVAALPLWVVPAFGGDLVISREVAVGDQDLAGRLIEPVAEMKEQLTRLGCSRSSLAYWSAGSPTQVQVEVRCRSWEKEVLPHPASGWAGYPSMAGDAPRSEAGH